MCVIWYWHRDFLWIEKLSLVSSPRSSEGQETGTGAGAIAPIKKFENNLLNHFIHLEFAPYAFKFYLK
jgi:hypothetical protein